MKDIQIKSDLIEQLIKISKEAGKAILEVYNTNFDYTIKEDLSPLTKADTISHNIICESLKVLTPDIPILSEENSDIPFNIRSVWKQYWLVDPLDGTKEFIKRNGEFTVNIALIENNIPIFGVIHVPVSQQTFWGSKRQGSFYENQNTEINKITISSNIDDPFRVVVSRSHPSPDLTDWLERNNNHKINYVGSSLKFCLIAKGEADYYPRFGPTSEWDTAAGQSILEYSGGTVTSLEGSKIKYNTKSDYINPNFLAHNNRIDLMKI
tara:strand:+ start:501 stop:1298 length:798 start_codon:yes stop_codon:yes gene_type:complete